MNEFFYESERKNLAAMMDKVCEDHVPVIITRESKQSVVLLSLKEYESLQETAYLLRSPVNAMRLAESIAELDAGD